MVMVIGWLTGPMTANVFCLHQVVKVKRQGITSFLPLMQMEVLQKNCPWPMLNTVLILPTGNKWHLFIEHRSAATGSVTAEDGKQISIFLISRPKSQRPSARRQMRVLNSRCGMVIPFIFSAIVARSCA